MKTPPAALRSRAFASRRCPVALVVLLAVSAGAAYAAQEATEKIVAVFTEYDLPPATLDLAWDAAAVVAHVRVQSSEARQLPTRQGPVGRPVTAHRVTVLEFFKGAELAGGHHELIVEQDSVDPALGGILHTSGGRVFKPSEEYVLFLERPAGRPTFWIAWGPGGGYRIQGNTVIVPGGARRMWQSRDEMSREQLVTALRLKRIQSQGN